MLKKLDALLSRYNFLSEKLSQAEVIADMEKREGEHEANPFGKSAQPAEETVKAEVETQSVADVETPTAEAVETPAEAVVENSDDEVKTDEKDEE